MLLVTKGRSAKHFPSQDTGLEVEVQGDGNFLLHIHRKFLLRCCFYF